MKVIDSNIIDEYGLLAAQIADLEAKRDALKQRLIAGEGLAKGGKDGPAYVGEGQLFRVSVTKGVRESLDIAAVRQKLSPQFIRANTIATEFVSVRCVARNVAKAA
jgi:hypothetical protein